MGIRGTRRTQELKGTVEKTDRTLIEIEVALAEHFRYLSNIVLFRAINVGETLPFYHETDCLVCSKAGYLTEIEIKRSWADFLADFRKDHRHEGEGCINQFYYCVPVSITDKVKEKLQIENIEYSGIITYDENLNMRVEVEARKLGAKKLSIDQRLHLARLGTIRAISLMKKIVKLQIQKKINANDMNYEKMLQWIGTHHTGISSRTMWCALMGVADENTNSPKGFDVPWDASDFSLCYDLVVFGEVTEDELKSVVQAFPYYKPIIEEWRKLVDAYTQKEYKHIYQIIGDRRDEIRKLQGYVKRSENYWVKRQSGISKIGI